MAAANKDVSPARPEVTSCTVTENAKATESNLITVVGILRGARNCRQASCLTGRAQRFVEILLARGAFFLTFIGANGASVVYSFTITSGRSIDRRRSMISFLRSFLAGTSPAQSAARRNDIAILNYALVLEHLEANFYTRFQARFTAQDFINASFTQQNYDYFNIIYVHELAHVRALQAIISQLGGTPVPACTYNFDAVTDVRSYITTARALENTGTMAYDGKDRQASLRLLLIDDFLSCRSGEWSCRSNVETNRSDGCYRFVSNLFSRSSR